MYSTCLFCHGPLGGNEALETFSVGRRIAFDPDKGRLWVVCLRCRRWNLSPIEERWEAVEEADRQFRESNVRVSTTNIGLARRPDGTDLVRIGDAQRSELSVWRYGDQFRWRRRKQYIYGGALIAVAVPVVMTGAYGALAAAVPAGGLLFQLPNWIHHAYMRYGVVARAASTDGATAVIRGKHVTSADIQLTDSGPRLTVRSDRGLLELVDQEALTVTGPLLTRINLGGANRKTVDLAVERIERAGGTESIFSRVAYELPGRLSSLPPWARFALEMATQEENERRAMEGELQELEAAWREAEEVAAISDRLLVPEWIQKVIGGTAAEREDAEELPSASGEAS
jgi:hypothetical protein